MKVKFGDEVKDIDIFFEKVPSGGGRPKKILTEEALKLIERMGELMCTEVEVCFALNTTDDTLNNENNKALYREAFEKGKANGRKSLRRKQYEVAMKGNCTMLIWLGKQWLDQKEKVETPPDNNECEMIANALLEVAKSNRGGDDNTNKEADGGVVATGDKC